MRAAAIGRWWLRALILGAALTVSWSAAQASEPVLIFTTSQRPVVVSESVRSQTFELDRVDNSLRALDKGLSADFNAAYAQVQKRLNEAKGRESMGQLNRAYEGIVLAWELGVERLPAIVFKRQFVVYGVESVDIAAQLMKEAQK